MGHKYNHPDVQNELVRKFFSIMVDEGTDISNLEQLSFCARTVDDDISVDEDFLGFYETDNINS